MAPTRTSPPSSSSRPPRRGKRRSSGRSSKRSQERSDEYPAEYPEFSGDDPWERPPGKVRKAWRILTHNVTITLVGIAAMLGAMVWVIPKWMGPGEPPKAAAGGAFSTNDMLARLSSSSMDPVAAGVIAQAKKNAYEEQQRRLKALKEKAKRDAKARAQLKFQQERERLAKSNPSAKQNKAWGKRMSAMKGWGNCWDSLETLWDHESSWDQHATNPSSGAYGIPQALPADKLADAGPDWKNSSPTQIAWGLAYIKARYHDPCGAWSWWSAHHWY
ncbi:aggregation-promoting factor C-terminal-like domain-containing protein [Actinomadura harenae]|uniref:Lytic transglycosylase domain-containing protein n=1 Tax=Actinomadura harenae TaxID=2483351 RepID=A0A3M2MDD6_9ACTN|nr:lytic transglycosylase domain-containing protein [Actinomadura harenae]RMI46655.1 lytic transglycosylase domain-containing protein [Actinomadura harenae]